MNCNYGKHVGVKASTGKLQEYLGITFDFTEKRKVKIIMHDYVETMINGFLMKITMSDTSLTPYVKKRQHKKAGQK